MSGGAYAAGQGSKRNERNNLSLLPYRTELESKDRLRKTDSITSVLNDKHGDPHLITSG